jgi:hypothetical protein
MAQAVSRRPLIAEARFQSQASSCGNCGALSVSGVWGVTVLLLQFCVTVTPPVLLHRRGVLSATDSFPQ